MFLSITDTNIPKCSGQETCKSFVECSSKYRSLRNASRCNLGPDAIGICCKDLLVNRGRMYFSNVEVMYHK